MTAQLQPMMAAKRDAAWQSFIEPVCYDKHRAADSRSVCPCMYPALCYLPAQRSLPTFKSCYCQCGTPLHSPCSRVLLRCDELNEAAAAAGWSQAKLEFVMQAFCAAVLSVHGCIISPNSGCVRTRVVLDALTALSSELKRAAAEEPALGRSIKDHNSVCVSSAFLFPLPAYSPHPHPMSYAQVAADIQHQNCLSCH